jgi:hypothetical protein
MIERKVSIRYLDGFGHALGTPVQREKIHKHTHTFAAFSGKIHDVHGQTHRMSVFADGRYAKLRYAGQTNAQNQLQWPY